MLLLPGKEQHRRATDAATRRAGPDCWRQALVIARKLELPLAARNNTRAILSLYRKNFGGFGRL